MQKLGNIFNTHKGLRVTLGVILADLTHGVRAPLVDLDLAAALPLCRDRQVGVVSAVCIPYENIVHPPLLDHEAMYDRMKRKHKVGWITSEESEKGVRYLVWVEVAVVLKLWNHTYIHLHQETEEERDARMKGTE